MASRSINKNYWGTVKLEILYNKYVIDHYYNDCSRLYDHRIDTGYEHQHLQFFEKNPGKKRMLDYWRPLAVKNKINILILLGHKDDVLNYVFDNYDNIISTYRYDSFDPPTHPLFIILYGCKTAEELVNLNIGRPIEGKEGKFRQNNGWFRKNVFFLGFDKIMHQDLEKIVMCKNSKDYYDDDYSFKFKACNVKKTRKNTSKQCCEDYRKFLFLKFKKDLHTRKCKVLHLDKISSRISKILDLVKSIDVSEDEIIINTKYINKKLFSFTEKDADPINDDDELNRKLSSAESKVKEWDTLNERAITNLMKKENSLEENRANNLADPYTTYLREHGALNNN